MKSISPKSHFDKHRRFLGPKRSTGPNANVFGQKKRGARRLDMKIAGRNTSSSFVWTLVVKKENTLMQHL